MLAHPPESAHHFSAVSFELLNAPCSPPRTTHESMAAVPPIMASVFEDDPTALRDVLFPELCVLPLY